jgi:hypothetical protein
MDYMSNPGEFSGRIKEKSAYLRHRVATPMLQARREAQETNRGKRGLAQIQNIGLKGLEIADWVSVSIGWDAVYRRALTEGKTEAAAAEYADSVVQKTQPSGREQDLAAMFKTRSPAMRLLTQFTTPLNVIWNQLTYDLPTAVINKNFREAVGIIAGYAIAGTMLGVLAHGIGGGDDEEVRRKRYFYYAFSQFFESAPLIGNGVAALAEYAITGEAPRMYQRSLFPAAEELLDAAKKVRAGDWERALGDAASAAALTTGLPVSAAKDLGRLTGIGDGDGKMDFNPEVLLGRSNK